MNKFAVGVIIGCVLLVGGIVWVTVKASDTGPLMGTEVEVLSSEHISAGTPHIPYNSNPPVAGAHYEIPQPAGIYDQELVDESVVHSLEHGGVWITYKPDLSKDDIEKLKLLVRKNRSKVILSPRKANDSLIALGSWGRLLKLDKLDENTVKRFIRANRDHAPEQLPL